MKALVELIETYRPGYSATVVPADESEIDILQNLVGPLPGSYCRFLKTMGASTGDFQPRDAVLDIRGVWFTTDQFKRLRRDRYLYIGEDEGMSSWDYYLDRERPYGEDDCMLVRMPLDSGFNTENRRKFQAGLEEFLYYEAFNNFRLKQFDYRVRLAQPKHEQPHLSCHMQTVCEIAEQQGLRRIPPAARCALYDRQDAALLLYQNPIVAVFSCDLGCDNPHELARLSEIFQKRTGMIPEHD